MDIINRDDVKPFITKDTSEIREILAPTNSSIEKQSLAEATLHPGGKTVEHCHMKAEEIYYILQGKGRIKFDTMTSDIRPGDGIAIPPGTHHQIHNTGTTDLVFLCLCVPPYTHEDTMLEE